MAVLPMKRVLICGLKKNRKEVLELLQRLGVVQVESDLPDDEIFQKLDKSDERVNFTRYADSATSALDILNSRSPEKKGLLSSLNGRKSLNVEEYEKLVAKRDDIMQVCKKIQTLDRECAENTAALPKLESQKIALEPWLTYDMPLDFSGTDTTTVMVGTLPNAIKYEEIIAKLTELAPDADLRDVSIISVTQVQTCIFVIMAKRDAQDIADALRKMGFAKAPSSDVNPLKENERLLKDMKSLQADTDKKNEEIRSFANRRDDIRFVVDYFSMRVEKYGVLEQLEQSQRVFMLEGYVPQKNAEKLKDAIESRYDSVVEYSDPTEQEDVPVLLSNNAFAAPLESVVESYSMPGKGEIDPSMISACFYYLLFGMMLSDAAYGIIIALACGILLVKKKNMEPGMKKMLTMFLYCGISTMICGFLFGSFFGDAVNVIATTFFNRPDISLPALWLTPLNEPMRLLGICFLIGIIHLFAGLGAKFYMDWRAGKRSDAIYDVVFWYMLLGGLIVILLTQKLFTDMMAMTWTLSKAAMMPAAIVAGLGALGILLTGGRESKSIPKRLLKGAYQVYGISGYLSDVLSYSRLLALGLATGVIAQVFNKMGSMLGGNFFGAIVFIVVFLIGHVLNILINILGAYVHSNRLTFVEFFGKFYDGGGRKFEPYAEHTKYYKIKEEIGL